MRASLFKRSRPARLPLLVPPRFQHSSGMAARPEEPDPLGDLAPLRAALPALLARRPAARARARYLLVHARVCAPTC